MGILISLWYPKVGALNTLFRHTNEIHLTIKMNETSFRGNFETKPQIMTYDIRFFVTSFAAFLNTIMNKHILRKRFKPDISGGLFTTFTSR